MERWREGRKGERERERENTSLSGKEMWHAQREMVGRRLQLAPPNQPSVQETESCPLWMLVWGSGSRRERGQAALAVPAVGSRNLLLEGVCVFSRLEFSMRGEDENGENGLNGFDIHP